MAIQKRIMAVLVLCASVTARSAEGSFYKNPGIFSTRPSEAKSLQTIQRFGPVGMGIDLLQPAFVMRIQNIEEGSPAAATGKLKKGQIIRSINGQTLKDIDPRIQLGQILADAEAADGVLRFAVEDEAEPVVVQIPELGSYSETWPLECPKSDKIVRGFADYLAKPGSEKGFSDIGMLFLLGTGQDEDVDVVRDWARGLKGAPTYAWHLGFGGIPLTEYYLRTGDDVVLPTIQRWVDSAVKAQYLDGWAGRGGVPRVTYGMGHLNAAGTAVVTFLLLAKECGADVPDHALLGALVHFYRYAGRGANPYGDDRPEVGFVDNGKTGNLAFAMAAAASLTPDGEESVYARARDACAMTSFYTTSFMLHGHTGGGIGEIWRSAAMGLLHEKKPGQYREFMDKRRWHYDLSRRFDGSFGILGGAGYDDQKKWKGAWGCAYTLAYVIPRRTLRITGAPPTPFSKPYHLPKQPWGTVADNVFLSLEAVPYSDGSRQDLSHEVLAQDSSRPVLMRLHDSGEISDDLLRRYIRHQDHNIRFVASNKILGINSGYIGWRTPGGEIRPKLMMECLRSNSPRIRRAMFSAIHEILKREKRTDVLTQEVFDLAIRAVADPDESWWVKDAALHVAGMSPTDWLAPHVDLLLPYLKHEDWWLQNATLAALTPVVADERCYREVLPAIGELVRTNQRSALTLGLMPSIRARIDSGTPAVHALARETLRETYTGYAGVKTAPGGQNISSTYDSHLEFIAASLADIPGGLDVLYEIARDRFPQQVLPYKQFFLSTDPARFGPKLRKAIKPIIVDELIPEYVGRNRESLRKLANAEVQAAQPGGHRDTIDQLTALHERAADDQYSWRMFADLRDAEWWYHSFDPIPAEHVPWDQLITRYRDVTPPEGMGSWHALDFDPAGAGWQRGQAPFGQYDGKIPTPPVSKCSERCVGPMCFGATAVNTLWEKEVLLLRGSFKMPPMKPGHRYRLRINSSAHVGNGCGYGVYINGRLLIEQTKCIGRGGGEKPNGAYITHDFLREFDGGQVTIAVKSFLRFNDKYKVKPSTRVPQGRISVHLEEMRLPPIGDDLVLKSATIVPMLSAEWQIKQDPDNCEQQPDDHKFRWDGTFAPYPGILGQWEVVGEVPDIAEFDPAEQLARARRPLFSSMTFKSGGATAEPLWIWSGNRLMDLTRYQVLTMRTKTLDDSEYLFVESGGFSTRNKPEWKSAWLVMKHR